MKGFVLTILSCAVVLEATFYGRGYGNIANSLGMNGGASDLGVMGVGGISRGQSGTTHDSEYGDQEYNAGANGISNHEYHSAGAGGFHNRGHHRRIVTSITQAEESSSHDIGGNNAYDSGAASNNGFNNFYNGASKYGNNFARGGMNEETIFG